MAAFMHAWRSMDEACSDPVSCNIKGAVPGWLKGSLYRNGSSKFNVGEDTLKHWFDGLAVVQKYSFIGGQVTYQNEYVKSVAYDRMMSAKRVVVPQFGTSNCPDPCKKFFDRYKSYFFGEDMVKDNTAMSLFQNESQLYVMTDSPLLYRIDTDTLETREQHDLQKRVPLSTLSPHPQQDADGTIYNIGTSLEDVPSYKFIKIPPPQQGDPKPLEKVEVVCSIPTRWPKYPSYYHSLAMTDSYLVFVEQPLALSLLKYAALGKFLNINSYEDCLEYYGEEGNIFHIVSKATGKCLDSLKSEAFFSFHHVNAYEDSGHIVMDLVGYPTGDWLNSLYLDKIAKPGPGNGPNCFAKAELRRYVLPLSISKGAAPGTNVLPYSFPRIKAILGKDGKVVCQPNIFKVPAFEFPSINTAYNAKQYRYVYGTSLNPLSTSKLVKIDTETSETKTWSDGPDMIPMEPIFVNAPGSMDEDNGVVLAPVLSGNMQKPSYLVILDAKTFQELGRAEQDIGVHVPPSLHGLYASTL